MPQGWHDLCTLAEDDTLFKTGLTVAQNQRPPTHKLELVPQQNKPAHLHHPFMHRRMCKYTLFDANCTVISARFLAVNFLCLSPPLTHSHSLTHTSLSLVCHPLLSQGLYCDIRQLVQFIKEAHGNVFRRVALSALLDSAEKVTTTKKPDEKEETKQPVYHPTE